MLPVFESNADYLLLTEGSAGEPGRYDLGMLERDVALARATPGRHMAGIFLRDDGKAVGVLDWLEENPSDGRPWLGLVMIRADRQREGLAREAVVALARHVRAQGGTGLRVGVIDRNEPGRAFAAALGFAPVDARTVRMARPERVTVLELALGAEPH